MLGIKSVEDTEAIVAKAIHDGIIEATIHHEEKYMQSKVERGVSPMRAFHKRIDFLLKLHANAVQAMRYPDEPDIVTDQAPSTPIDEEQIAATAEAGLGIPGAFTWDPQLGRMVADAPSSADDSLGDRCDEDAAVGGCDGYHTDERSGRSDAESAEEQVYSFQDLDEREDRSPYAYVDAFDYDQEEDASADESGSGGSAHGYKLGEYGRRYGHERGSDSEGVSDDVEEGDSEGVSGDVDEVEDRAVGEEESWTNSLTEDGSPDGVRGSSSGNTEQGSQEDEYDYGSPYREESEAGSGIGSGVSSSDQSQKSEPVVGQSRSPSSSPKSDVDPDRVLSKYATDVRCRVLQNELRILRGEIGDWVEREKELLERIQWAREELKEQRRKVLDAQSKVHSLEQELDLVNLRSKSRQETLERSYRTLCENLRLAEEALLRGRLDLRRLQARNLVLEELLQAKTLAYEQLEGKMTRVTLQQSEQVGVCSNPGATCENTRGEAAREESNGGYVSERNSPVMAHGESCGEPTAANLAAVGLVSHLESMSPLGRGLQAGPGGAVGDSCGGADVGKSQRQSDAGTVAMLPEVRVSEDGTGQKVLQELSHLMQTHLKQMISCSKEVERQMRDAVDLQIEELKELLQQTRMDLSYKTEECNALARALENVRGELEAAKGNLSQSLEAENKLKEQLQVKVLELEVMEKELSELNAQYQEAKRELGTLVLRERQSKAAFDDYVKDTDVKLHKMELMLSNDKKDAAEVGRCDAATQADNPAVPPEPPAAELPKVSQPAELKFLDSAQTESGQGAEMGKIKEAFKETVVKLLKKVDLLTEKLKEQVVRAYNGEQKVKELEAQLGPACACRKSLENAKAAKRKYCWCRNKGVGEVRQLVARAAVKLDSRTASAVLMREAASKKRKSTPRDGVNLGGRVVHRRTHGLVEGLRPAGGFGVLVTVDDAVGGEEHAHDHETPGVLKKVHRGVLEVGSEREDHVAHAQLVEVVPLLDVVEVEAAQVLEEQAGRHEGVEDVEVDQVLRVGDLVVGGEAGAPPLAVVVGAVERVGGLEDLAELLRKLLASVRLAPVLAEDVLDVDAVLAAVGGGGPSAGLVVSVIGRRGGGVRVVGGFLALAAALEGAGQVGVAGEPHDPRDEGRLGEDVHVGGARVALRGVVILGDDKGAAMERDGQ
ncbi:26S proteasome non-ATPase regulatory subunit 3 [Babesia caballi]|uniref:26S proteasome non-ATPase regulatory subunit 3 n=1 Tax=Babesia caballi TaxID=5871 RepID=A0AAV4LZJ0_BABCB|nr:26S proteasome non-ATPase regulatory subunit 3 [Babesia caballi]